MSYTLPTFALRIDDVAHPGFALFNAALDPTKDLKTAALSSFIHLYTPTNAPKSVVNVLLILRSMGGVAHTCGSRTHKEIHLSLEYIVNASKVAGLPDGNPPKSEDVRRSTATVLPTSVPIPTPIPRPGYHPTYLPQPNPHPTCPLPATPLGLLRHELMGVLTHEFVHCFQYDGQQTCPSGLIEGIADYVRLRSCLSPPHWFPLPIPSRWDAGYQHTGFFLAWIEEREDKHRSTPTDIKAVARINALLEGKPYTEDIFNEVTGHSVEWLWRGYCSSFLNRGWGGGFKGEEMEVIAKGK